MFRFHKEIVDESLSDLEIIKGLQVCDKKIEESFYLSCRRYFLARRFGAFDAVHAGAREPQDLFHDSFLKLWQEIQARRIFVCDNYTWRVDKPLPSTLTIFSNSFIASLAIHICVLLPLSNNSCATKSAFSL